MTEPLRIVDHPASDLGSELVRSAAQDRPSAGAKRRAVAALGLATGLALPAATAKAAGTLLGAKTSAATLPLALIAKWTAIGVASGVLVLGTGKVLQSNLHDPSMSKQAPVAAATVSARPVAVAGPAQVESLPVLNASSHPMMAQPSTSVSQEPSASLPVVQPPSLAAETALIDEARRALQARDARGATAALDRRDSQFPRGSLGMEGTVLRVEALMLGGDPAGARALGTSFMASHPRSPLCRRVRSLLGIREGRTPED